jgi:hypothetical protein
MIFVILNNQGMFQLATINLLQTFMKIFFLSTTILLLTFLSACNTSLNENDKSNVVQLAASEPQDLRTEYLAVMKQLHELECTYMMKSKTPPRNYNSSYEFRSDAFQEILKDLNRKNLVAYEDVCFHLAELQHELSREELILFNEDMEKEYQQSCK